MSHEIRFHLWNSLFFSSFSVPGDFILAACRRLERFAFSRTDTVRVIERNANAPRRGSGGNENENGWPEQDPQKRLASEPFANESRKISRRKMGWGFEPAWKIARSLLEKFSLLFFQLSSVFPTSQRFASFASRNDASWATASKSENFGGRKRQRKLSDLVE